MSVRRIKIAMFIAAVVGLLLGVLNAFVPDVASQTQSILAISTSNGAAPLRTTQIAYFPTASTTTSVNETAAAIAEKGSRWTVVSAPAVSTQASASIAAEAAVRHVADSICFSAGSTTAPALTNLTVNLRDGATGAGTVIGSWDVVISAATGQNVAPYCVTGLNLVGTTNTAMTLEFSALLTSLFEDVTLTGFNIGS